MTDGATLCVVETFLSIQGESTHAGRLCFFIRLAGCNLRCRYCDTRYAWNPADGQDRTVATLTGLAVQAGVGLTEITGGEPLFQEATPELCRRLLAAGQQVMLETNGAYPIDPVPEAVMKILDCKTPSSGEAERMCRANYERLQPHDEIKFVIADRPDYDYATEIIRRYRLPEKTANLLFSPAWGEMTPRRLAEWMIADRVPARMQLQMHKYIWEPNARGV